MSKSYLWLSQNAQWYRRMADLPMAGTAAITTRRFVQNLESDEYRFAVVQLPIPPGEILEIARAWRGLSAPPLLVVFDPMQCLGRGEFPDSWPADWHVLRSSSESAVKQALSELAKPPPLRPLEPWRSLLIGNSESMSQIRELIGMVAPLNATVLITGSTGTGKEVAARAIHLASKRADKPFVAINCAALPDTLLEAELFGHTKGAFTGAVNVRAGLFEQADGGTIFLDEIGDMPIELQVKLLRVIQERQILRLGSSESTPVNVRIITATNADLKKLCAVKRFRQDLFFRLNVVPVKMPLLKDRPADVVPLLDHFLKKTAQDENLPLKRVEPEAVYRLIAYTWPGNVRELEHAVERAVAITGPRNLLRFEDFSLDDSGMTDSDIFDRDIEIPHSGFDFERALQQFQIAMINRAMRTACGNKQRAATLLGLKRTTMISKFKALEYCV